VAHEAYVIISNVSNWERTAFPIELDAVQTAHSEKVDFQIV